MSQIAVLSDFFETQNEDEEIFFIKTTKKIRVAYIRIKLPDENEKYFRYHSSPVKSGDAISGMSLSREFQLIGSALNSIQDTTNSGSSSNPSESRRRIILEKIDELSDKGFHVSEKYISLFISGKINELILSRTVKGNNDQDKRKNEASTRARQEDGQIDEIDNSALAKILRKNMQRDS